jgi:hypothetical protein
MAWAIRSIKNNMIVEAHGFYVTERYDIPRDARFFLLKAFRGEESLDWLLAEYLTEEAALAELDAIERWIERGASGVYQIGT